MYGLQLGLGSLFCSLFSVWLNSFVLLCPFMRSFRLSEYFEFSVLIPSGHLAILLYFSPPLLYFMYLFLFLKFFLCWIFTASRLSLAVGLWGPLLLWCSGLAVVAWRLSLGRLSSYWMWDLSSWTRDQAHVPCFGRWIFNHWASREVPILIFEGFFFSFSQF